MITVGIIDSKNEIKGIIGDILKKQNIPMGESCEDEKSRYVFLKAPFEKKCDIIIDADGGMTEENECCIYMYNSDEKIKRAAKNALVISYGLNSLATVTASSIDEEGESLCFQYCLQREIVGFSGKKTEPQEFPVRFGRGISIRTALAVVTFMILCGLTAHDLLL